MTALYAQAGDVFFTKSSTILGRLIRWGEKDKGEVEATWANHAGVVVEDGYIGGGPGLRGPAAIVIEALWKTRKGPLVLNGTEVRVFRPVPAWTAEELEHFIAAAEPYVGDKYGWHKLLVQLADKLIFGGKKRLTTLLHIQNRPICSFLAALVVHAAQSKERVAARVMAGYKNGEAFYAFGIPPQAADPDEMLDWCETHTDLWNEVR